MIVELRETSNLIGVDEKSFLQLCKALQFFTGGF
jgi:hypothetical protein